MEFMSININAFKLLKKKNQRVKENSVFEVIPYSNQKCISVQWVCSFKETNNGLEQKGRLAARKYEDSLTSFEKQSPTTSKNTFHVLLSTTAP